MTLKDATTAKKNKQEKEAKENRCHPAIAEGQRFVLRRYAVVGSKAVVGYGTRCTVMVRVVCTPFALVTVPLNV